MADQDEKTEEPTAKRKTESRKKGQVAKSTDLNSAVMLIAAALIIWMLGGYVASWLRSGTRECFVAISSLDLSLGNTVYFARAAGKLFFYMLGPILLIFFVVALIINVLQVGFLWTFEPMKPKFGKMFGPEAFKRLVSPDKLVDLGKNIAKMFVVGVVVYHVVSRHYVEYLFLADQSLGLIVKLIFNVFIELILKCALLLLILGLLDLWYQRYKTKKGMKMTKQEIKDEMKSSDGDPKIKAKIRGIRMEMHRKMMMEEVPKATVVVTNPSFIAIAIRYDQKKDVAPFVVAKGKRLIAERIKKIAVENDIPIVEDKPLARSMFDVVQAGEELPSEFFGPVAEILAYVYNLKPQEAVGAVS
jgi:flagellar biosynthetic protein FlhB